MRPRLAWLLVAALAALGCRDKSPRPDPAPEAPARKDAGTAKPMPTAVRVALLDSGQEPRSQRRYLLSVGDKQRIVLRLSNTATNRVRAATPTTLVFPQIKLVFHVEIVEALNGDRVRYRFDLGESALSNVSGADKRLVREASEALKQARGIRGSAVVDTRGIIRDGTIELPDGLSPSVRMIVDSMRSSMEQLTVPFPSEPIGVGAQWEVSQTMVQAQAVLNQSVVYELVKSDEGALELRGTVEQEGERQDVPLPGFEYAELISLSVSGETTAMLNLERLAPSGADMKLSGESRYEFAKKGGRRQALRTMSNSTIEVSSK